MKAGSTGQREKWVMEALQKTRVVLRGGYFFSLLIHCSIYKLDGFEL